MKEIIFPLLLLIFVPAIIPLSIWYWAMKKNKATLLLLISLFAFVTLGLGAFFWLGSKDKDITIFLISIGATISNSIFLFVLSKVAPQVFEALGIKRKQ